MILEKERKLVVEYGIKLIKSGLTTGTGGNVSIFNREEKLMAISPSGIDYFEIKPEDVVIMNLDDKVVDGDKTPSSEHAMHKIFYKKRTDINAVVHSHSKYATTISCLNWDLPALDYLVAFAGKNVRCAKYATYGTPELAENAFEAMKDRYAVLLANHGLLSGSINIASAFSILEEIEFCAGLYYRTKAIGEPVILSDEEMELMGKRFQNYGQKK